MTTVNPSRLQLVLGVSLGFGDWRLGFQERVLEFTSVQGIKPNVDGTLRLNFAYRGVESGKTNQFPFMLRLHDSGWKVVVEGEPPPGFQAGR